MSTNREDTIHFDAADLIVVSGEDSSKTRCFWLDVSKISAVVPRAPTDRTMRGCGIMGGCTLIIDGKVIESSADPAEVAAWVEAQPRRRPSPSMAAILHTASERLEGFTHWSANDDIVDDYNAALRGAFLAGMHYQQGMTLEEAFGELASDK